MTFKIIITIFLGLSSFGGGLVFGKNETKQKKIILKKIEKKQISYEKYKPHAPTDQNSQALVKSLPEKSQRSITRGSFSKEAAGAIANGIMYAYENKGKIAVIGGAVVVATFGLGYLIDPIGTTAVASWIFQKFLNWAHSVPMTPEDVAGKRKNAERVGNFINNSIETIVKTLRPSK